MTSLTSADGRCHSILVTPDEVESKSFPEDSVVVIVSNDCIEAVDAAQEVQVRHGVYIGDSSDPELAEMRAELYDRTS